MPQKEFFPLSHAHQEIETLTADLAPKIITANDLQTCETGILHHRSWLSGLHHVDDMITLMSTHSQRPFYMVNRENQKKLFMYSPKCHAHFMAGAVTTVLTNGKAYFTVGNKFW